MIPPPIVAFRGVRKSFGGSAALRDATFDIAPGECVALLGPSGCGKTTTLRLLAGFETPDAGAIAIGGRDMRGVPPFERPIGLVFQDYALFPHMTVAGNVGYGMKRRGVPAAERTARSAAMLGLVRLVGLDARRPAQLSGGQQQRVALARALATKPALLLLDEPLSNLDARLRHDLRSELRAILRLAGTTTLMVTHDQEEALAMADRVVLMNAGRVERVGAPETVYARPATRFAAHFLGRCNWLDGTWLDGAQVAVGALVFTTTSPAGRGPTGLAIRPERVRIARGVPSSANGFEARFVEIRRLGPEVEIELDLAGIRLQASRKADGRPLPVPGEACTVSIDPEACVPVPSGEPS